MPGAPATLVESLTPDALVAKPIPPLPATARHAAASGRPSQRSGAAAETGPLRRFYLALAFSPRGRPGPPGTVAELRLTALPDAPIDGDGDAHRRRGSPRVGAVGRSHRLSPRPLAPIRALAARQSAARPHRPRRDGATRGPDSLQRVPRIAAPTTPPRSLQPLAPASPKPPGEGGKPDGGPSADHRRTTRRVDLLRSVDRSRRTRTLLRGQVRPRRGGAGGRRRRPPNRPASRRWTTRRRAAGPPVNASSGEGAITLIWEPNAEPDVAGYLVLRGEAGDATLTPVTDTVVTESRYTDRTVKPGVRYVYAVQAIDTRLPRPNVSDESARVEETAR